MLLLRLKSYFTFSWTRKRVNITLPWEAFLYPWSEFHFRLAFFHVWGPIRLSWDFFLIWQRHSYDNDVTIRTSWYLWRQVTSSRVSESVLWRRCNHACHSAITLSLGPGGRAPPLGPPGWVFKRFLQLARRLQSPLTPTTHPPPFSHFSLFHDSFYVWRHGRTGEWKVW